MKAIVLFVGLALFLGGCAQQDASLVSETGAMQDEAKGVDSVKTVEAGNTVKVEYVGSFPNTREVFDKSDGRGPLEFVAGSGQMIQGFDEAVIGMELNEEKTVTIPPEKAYGAEGGGQTLEVPVEQIQGEEEVQVGTTLLTSNGQQGTITAIENGVATVLFVHPLAGKTLEFWIKVVEIN